MSAHTETRGNALEGRINVHPILTFEEGQQVQFTFDGVTLYGHEGEPIVAALHAAGVRVLGYSKRLRRPRGYFCAIGNCSSCLMTVDGRPNVRVCVERLRAGMDVRTQKDRGQLLGQEGLTADHAEPV